MRLPEESIAFLSAALRHLRDAERLLQVGEEASPDQAYHLAGYGPECARKATLALRQFDKRLGHDLTAATETIVAVATSLDPLAHRYRGIWASSPRTVLASWNPQVRYEQTGTRPPEQAAALLCEARKVVDEAVLALWADGRLEAIP